MIWYAQSDAQSCGMVVHDAKTGLAGGNFLCIFQDSKGILWVGNYNAGLSRYDGKRWANWSQQSKELFSNTVSDIFEDKEGGIWLDHTTHGVSRWKEGKMQSFDFQQDTCAKGMLYYDLEAGKVGIVEGFRSGGAISARIFEYDYKARRFVDTGEKAVADGSFEGYSALSGTIGQSKRQWWATVTYAKEKTSKFFHVVDGVAHILPIRSGTYDRLMALNKNPECGKANFQNEQGFFMMEGNRWAPLPAPKLPYISNSGDAIELQFNYSSYDLSSHSFFVIWGLMEGACDKKRYVLGEYDPATMKLRQTILFSIDNFSTAGDAGRQIRKDMAGTIWLATFNNVIRLFPDQLFIPESAPGMVKQALAIAQAGDGNLWVASNGGGLVGFNGVSLVPQPKELSRTATFVDGGYADVAGNVYFSSTAPFQGIFKFDGKNHWENLAGGKDILGYYISHDKKGQLLWGTMGKGLWLLPNGKLGKDTSDWFKIDKAKGLKLDNVLTALEDRYGRYWMGRLSEGIALYDPKQGKVQNWLRTNNPKNFGCVSMAEDARGNLWFGTDRGLCFFENRQNIKSDFNLSAAMQLIGVGFTGPSTIMSCQLYDANTLIFGNETGFYTLDLAAFYEKKRRVLINSYNALNGYEAGPVGQNAFFLDRDSFLWMTATQGVVRFAPRALPLDTIPPSVVLDSLVAGGEVFTDLSKTIRLTVDERFVQIHFHAPPNPMLYDNTSFEYKLKEDSDWTAVPKGEASVSFPRLEPGTYQIEIRAVKEGLYSATSTVVFRIPPIWWQDPLFWSALLGVVILTGIYLRRKESKIHQQALQIERSKVEIESMGKEKNKLQVQAIVNQLNPHFINNALQWLQVRLDEDLEAVGVVGKLSENISTVFKNSRQKKAHHALGQEVKLAENYLFIQKCRFRDKLEYEMPDEEILRRLENVDVPLMVIQIHVENAVEHGIRNKMTGGGKVTIKLQDEPDYAIISIEDNGVGRAAAKVIGSKGTQNGTLMLKELETIYNLQNKLPLSQQYEDNIFTDETGKPHGTRVIIRVPKSYNFEL